MYNNNGVVISWALGIILLFGFLSGHPTLAKVLLVVAFFVGGYGTLLSVKDWWRTVTK